MGSEILKTYFEWDGDLDTDVSELRLEGGKAQHDNIQPLGTWSGMYPHARFPRVPVYNLDGSLSTGAPPFSTCFN